MLTVILTGGASRRMGRDKAMLPYGGSTMLQYLIDKYSALGPVAVSVNKSGRFPFTGAAELCDPYPDLGPLNGIVSAFSETDADCIFLTGTDLPFGDTALVEKLMELRGDADACVPPTSAIWDTPLPRADTRPEIICGTAFTISTMMVGRFLISEVSRSIPACTIRGILLMTALTMPEIMSGIADTMVVMI